jgi:hypothetical protein
MMNARQGLRTLEILRDQILNILNTALEVSWQNWNNQRIYSRPISVSE